MAQVHPLPTEKNTKPDDGWKDAPWYGRIYAAGYILLYPAGVIASIAASVYLWTALIAPNLSQMTARGMVGIWMVVYLLGWRLPPKIVDDTSHIRNSYLYTSSTLARLTLCAVFPAVAWFLTH